MAGSAADRPTGLFPQGAPPEGAPPSGDPAPSGAAHTGHPSASASPDEPPSTSISAEEGGADATEVTGDTTPGADEGHGNEAGAGDTEVLEGEELEGDEAELDVDADLDRLVEDVERLQGEREELLDQLLRTRADFENYRKRMIRQQAEQAERAAEDLIVKLLEVLDVFDAAMAHGQGYEQACGRLAVLLEKEGLARIEPVGAPFDPTEADAVAHEPAHDGEKVDGPTVSDVLRAGYRWKGRVLRPAMVKVRG